MFKQNDRVRIRETDEVHTVRVGGPSALIELDNGVSYPEEALRLDIPVRLKWTAAYREEISAAVTARRVKRVRQSQTPVTVQGLLDVARRLGDLPVTFLNGHWKSGEAAPGNTLGDPRLVTGDLGAIFDLLEAPGDQWISWRTGLDHTPLSFCPYCRKNIETYETNGREVRFAGPPCSAASGEVATETELNVPSGKLVYRAPVSLFPLLRQHFESSQEDQQEQMRLYAAAGLLLGPGSRHVDLRKISDGRYHITTPPEAEIWDRATKTYQERVTTPSQGTKVRSQIDDGGWYTLCDLEEYQRRQQHFGKGRKRPGYISVRPGVYRLRHDHLASMKAGEEPIAEVVHGVLEWVREPDPVRDLLATYRDVEVNPHAYVQCQLAAWPTLYGAGGVVERDAFDDAGRTTFSQKEVRDLWERYTPAQREKCWQKVADHIFCTIGGGTDWHPKGFPVADPDPLVEDIEPPSLRGQYHWYPFSRPYGGMFEQRTLTPAFAKFLFRSLESIISFGIYCDDPVHRIQELMAAAAARYRELAEQYPEQADPEYVQWLADEARVRRWISNFVDTRVS